MAVCVVIGAGPGVGNSVAKAFYDRGYHVAICARDENKLANLAASLGERVSTWKVDVSDHAALTATLGDISSKHGEVEILHFNAFSLAAAKATDLEPGALNASLQVNVIAALVSVQAVLPSMLRNGKGSVLITGGGFALHPSANLAALSVGKAGLRALAQCLYQELKSKGVHVGTVTICGTVQPGTEFDPHLIAQEFVRLHDQPNESFEAEVLFSGGTPSKSQPVEEVSFPYKALVSFRFKGPVTNEIKALVPAEQARVAELREQNIVTDLYLAKDGTHGWLSVQGQNKESILAELDTLPMRDHLHFDFEEIC